jgi:ribosomal protein S18
MKIVVAMSPENYDSLLNKLSPFSTEYSLLKNGVVTGGSAKANRIIEIACERSQAQALLRVAHKLAPEAAVEIDTGVTLARPFQK